MSIVYDLIYVIFLLVYFPYMVLKRKLHPGLWMRFGFWPEELKGEISKRKNVWIHAVSVGEILAVTPLVKSIRAEYSQLPLVISTVTRTGYELAKKSFGSSALIIYAPLDLSAIVRQCIRWIDPVIYITVETEIWPNLFCALNQEKIPIVIVNGRISDKAFPQYRLVAGLVGPVLKMVSKFCMQSKFDAQRIVALGADPAKVEVVGNIKFDDLPFETTQDQLVVNPSEMLWIAGSTHPGEEEIVLDTYQSLRKEFPGLRLILAPRHVERVKEVEQLILSKGLTARMLSYCRREFFKEKTVVLVDVIGQLRYLYKLATVVFIGKSLTAHGGQNMIEPAFYGKPVVVGPYTENFKNVVAELLEVKGILQVANSAQLKGQMQQLLSNPSLRQSIGDAAKALVQKNKGVTAKTFHIIKAFLSTATAQY